MNNEVINRATDKIGADDFVRLTRLNLEHTWLSYEPEALFELWCLSENDEQKNTIEFLIKKFTYIDERRLKEGCQLIADCIQKRWELDAKNTYLLATCDDSKPDGSQTLIQNLKNKFSISWNESNFFNSILSGANEVPTDSNIILVDDFIGTGDTITRKFKYLNKKIIERSLNVLSVKIVSLASMNFSLAVLNEFGVDYYSVHWLKKGISELAPCDKRDVVTKSMEDLEEKLQKKYQNRKIPNFGYKRSESLFALGSNNIPNNVFPIFWWPSLRGGISRKTMFRRV